MSLRPVTTWTLEMTERPDPATGAPSDVRIEMAPRISPEFARYLYAVVGGPWTWTDRLDWTREQWATDLSVDGTETYVASIEGEPAGYVQIQPTPADTPEARGRASVEIRYFGLVESAMGRGVGRALLQHGIDAAWTLSERHVLPATQRVWVHTCDLDGPAALTNYQRRGFTLVDETREPMDYPESPLGAWRSTGGPS